MRADPAGALEQRVHAVKISPCDAAGGRRAFDGGAAMITRRQLLKAGAVGGAALLVPWEATTRAWAAIPGGSLDPTTIAKYALPANVS